MTATFRTSNPVSAADPRRPHLVLVGLPVCAVGLWQLTPRAFWGGLAIMGALAAGWGVYRAGRR